jgi:hypothetical protein
MANNRFQHKRSTVSGVVPTTSDISAGELGINLADRRIFTSNGSAVFELGANLTNLAVSGNVTIGASGSVVFTPGAGIFANGSLGTAGQVLTSNATSVYWSTVSAGGVRSVSIASASTVTPTSDSADQYNVTALAEAATIATPSGTPANGQRLILRFKDDGTGRALTWTTSSGGYRAVGVTLPTTTVATKTTYVGCLYNSTDIFWDVVASVTQA